ncbi:MAG: hypothetical protein PVI43_00345 [Candidatus Bathyarchaeota archaeon]|jgi:hypothetical protein
MNLKFITKQHPLYTDILEALKVKDFGEYVNTDIDWNALVDDYNNLHRDDVMAFLVFSKSRPSKLQEPLKRRGIRHKSDFVVRVLPVMALEASDAIGNFPQTPIPDSQLKSYLRASPDVEPDEAKFPILAEADKILPRRSNKSLTADSLPIMAHVWQVYIVKMSDAVMKKIYHVSKRSRKNKLVDK